MPNRARGEAELLVAGKSYRLLLTLGALAEIEDGLGLANLGEISKRLAQARASDFALVAAALLRGGGHEMTAQDVLALPCDLGALVTAVRDAFEAAGLSGEGGGGASGPFAGAACSN
jgi:Phage tail tube protein, GTA-gp10